MLLALIFTGMLILSLTLFLLLTGPSTQDKRLGKRLDTLTAQLPADRASARTGQLLLKQSAVAGRTPHLDALLRNLSVYPRLERLIVQSHRHTTPGRLLLTSAGLAAAGLAAGTLAGAFLPFRLAASVAGASMPWLLLRFHRARWLKRYNAGLSDAVDLLSRALKAGHSVASAMEVVAEQGPRPVAEEFSEAFQAQNFGLPFRDALLQMIERVPSPDLRILVTAMLVQKETGGNLTEILDRTAHLIRERSRIQGEVRIKTAQGRLTGWILILLPIGLGLLINLINPGYARPLFHDPLGRKMLYAAAGMISIGGFFISRIVRIEV